MEKKKKVFIFLGIILFIFCNFFAIVYADDNREQNNFFSANKTEVAIGDTVELKIDLEKIGFDNFNFVLSTDVASVDINDIYTNDTNLDTNINDNELSITIDKTKTNVNQINLYYKIPENVKVGDQINLIAEISRINNGEDNSNAVNEVNNEIIEEVNLSSNKVINNNEVEEIQINQIVLTIVDKSEDAGKEDFDNNENINEQPENFDNQQNPDKENNNQNMTNQRFNSNEVKQETNKTSTVSNISVTSQTSKTAENVVSYNGSQNNYLESITIEGYELNNSFTKENTTYFITVDEETTSVDVVAEAEADSATVCIYGNNNLKEGTNKILISVTSESGEVRTYRIYVEK